MGTSIMSIAHSLCREKATVPNNQRLILNELGINKAPHTHRVFATAWRAEQRPSDGNYRLHEAVDLDVCLVNNGQPLTERIAALVKERLGPEWQFTWEAPEPTEEF